MSTHRSRLFATACLLATAALLTACGGDSSGGGELAAADPTPPGSSGGIGGSGVITTGTVTGSGSSATGSRSLFVNGQGFTLGDADLLVDDAPVAEAALTPGMIVTLEGRIDDATGAGTAARVSARTALRGPVATLERAGDGSSLQLRVLGTPVIVERDGTVFAETDFDALAPGVRVAIDGLPGADGRLRATRVKAAAGPDAALLAGTISALDGTAFRLGDQAVEAASAVLRDLPDGLEAGLRVQVRGSLDGELLRATRVDGIAAPAAEDTTRRLEGRVSSVGEEGFLLEGIRVLSDGAERSPADLILTDGLIVEAIGRRDGETLVAEQLVGRRGRLQLAGPVAAIDDDADTLAVQLPTGVVTLTATRRTLIEDGRDQLPFPTLADLRIGDYLVLEALRDSDGLLATRIDRRPESRARVLQAPVDGFTPAGELTLLGITLAVDSARFQGVTGSEIDSERFFANLSAGALVRTVDDNGDGSAERVEFEFPLALDGELAFRDAEALPGTGDDAPPAAILTAVAAQFPGQDIAGAWREEERFELVLIDGTRLFFAEDGTLLGSIVPGATPPVDESDDHNDSPGGDDSGAPVEDGDQGGDEAPDSEPPGEPAPDEDTENPGASDDNPGQGDDSPGQDGDNPGQSGDNPGQGGDVPGQGGGKPPDNPNCGVETPGAPGDDPGCAGAPPGNPDAIPGKPGQGGAPPGG